MRKEKEREREFYFGHRAGAMQGLFVPLSLRMKPRLQKQPETHWKVHISGLYVHVSGQAVPHVVYS